MANLTGLGGRGEDIATAYLSDNGYKIIERNFTSRFGEIDIVARKESYICFVEVKTRKPSKNFASGFESIDFNKQQKILKTAQYFLSKNHKYIEHLSLQPRFDCIEIDFESGSIDLIENAFDFG